MNVTLLKQSNNIKDIADMASICYGHEEAKYPERLFRNLIRLGHTSVLEFMTFTFKIEGISRACLAQLTRHRHASFIVESQRYVKYDRLIGFAYPNAVLEEGDKTFSKMIKQSWENYRKLLDMGAKPEDARMILPNAVETNLYMNINLRSLINFFQLRMDKSAQWEIRELANEIFKLLDKDLQGILKEEVLKNV